MNLYDAQLESYNKLFEHYWGQISPTMLQKVSMLTAHVPFPPGARIADMGCGNGDGSFHLALTNPQISVVGIDITEKNILIAREKYKDLKNLTWEVGDAEFPKKAWGKFDCFLNSSSAHHYYSYNQYDEKHVINAFVNQYKMLNPNGILVVRDFVAMSEDDHAYIELSNKPRNNQSGYAGMSDADLFIEFSKTAHPLTPKRGQGFFAEKVASTRPDYSRFYTSQKWASEFLLRIDYRDTWESELNEHYGFWTDKDYKRELAKLGGRMVYTAPLWNRWIIENRYIGRVGLFDENEKPMGYPPTNYIAIVEKVANGESSRFKEKGIAQRAPSYLQINSFRHTVTGAVHDLVSRPGYVIDFVPYIQHEGDPSNSLSIFAKANYPRPLACAEKRGSKSLDGKSFSGHIVEPFALANIGNEADALAMLAKRMDIKRELLSDPKMSMSYYPQVGISNELVDSYFVKVNPEILDGKPTLNFILSEGMSGYSTSGEGRLYRAQDILRSAQVGVLPEARLETNVYALMRDKNVTPDAWLDGVMKMPNKSDFHTEKVTDLFKVAKRSFYEPTLERSNYISHHRSVFAEYAHEDLLGEQDHEFVVHNHGSSNIAVVLPVARNKSGELCIGLRKIELPAPQDHTGNSTIYVAPNFVLPKSIGTLYDAEQHMAKRLGCEVNSLKRLGDSFFSSIGIMTEKAYPYVALVDPTQLNEDFHFIKMSDWFANIGKFQDAPLLTSAFRAVHAFGMWEKCQSKRPENKAAKKAGITAEA